MSSKERAKSDKAHSNIVTLSVTPSKLRAILHAAPASDPDATMPSSPENKNLRLAGADAADSAPNTPRGTVTAGAPSLASALDTPGGTPAPADSPLKKKGVKRSAAAAGVDGGSAGPGSVNGDTPVPAARARSKPGPKKKAKLDDNAEPRSSGAHKLGPKASMGAINAGLRALDRSGKPCRKWTKRRFTLKTFTGVAWSLPRWKAPAKALGVVSETDGTPLATATSDVDMLNAPTPSLEPATSAPTPIAV